MKSRLRGEKAVGEAGCEFLEALTGPRGAGQPHGCSCWVQEVWDTQLSKAGTEGRGKSSVSSRAEHRGVLRLLQPIPALLPPLCAGFCHPQRSQFSLFPYNFIQPLFVQPFLAQLGGKSNKTPCKVSQTAGK